MTIQTKIKPAAHALGHLRTKSTADPLDALAEKFADMTDVTIARIQALEEKTAETNAGMDEIAKIMSRPGGSTPILHKSWGEEFIKEKSADLRDLAGANSGTVQLATKGTITGSATSGGPMDVPMRDTPANQPMQPLSVRDVLRVTPTDSGTIEYAEQTTRTNAADMVAEGAAKPESDYGWTLRTVPTRVLAHWVKASNQIIEDSPAIRGIIDGELRYGLRLKEEEQILYGDGNNSNLTGLTPNAAVFANPIAGLTLGNELDVIATAILQVTLADHMPNAVVMHPSDWMKIRLLKDADGRYILGDPQQNVAANVFGTTVVPSQSMTAGQFLAGDFEAAATLYDRWTPRVELGYAGDDFTRNLVTIRAEERIGLAVRHSDAMSFGTFAAALA